MRFVNIPTVAALAVAGAACVTLVVPGTQAQERLGQSQQIDEETLNAIIKSLNEAGMDQQEINRFVEGLGGGAALPDPRLEGAEPTQTITTDAQGQPLHLPLGSRLDLAFDAGAQLELPFYADGPGMLTVVCFAGEAPAYAEIEVELNSGEQLLSETRRSSGLQEGVRMVPVGAEGEYTVRIGGLSGEVTVLAEWLPFPALRGSELMLIPNPDSAAMNNLQANTQAEFATRGSSGAWCQFDAAADGQLVVELKGDGGDLQLNVYGDGDFANSMLYVDGDQGGSVAHEVVSIPVRAGRRYNIHIDANRDTTVQIESKTVFVPLPDDARVVAPAEEPAIGLDDLPNEAPALEPAPNPRPAPVPAPADTE